MYFAQYIQLLHRHLSLGMNQADFTKVFLCRAYNLKESDAPSPSSCKSYFAGKKQNSGSEKIIVEDTIGAFAVKMLKQCDDDTKTVIDLQKLPSYLKDLIERSDAASQIVASFRQEMPEIDSNDVTELAQKLVDLFSRIIDRTVNDYLKAHSRNEGSDYVPIFPQMKETDKCEIMTILKKIKKALEKLEAALEVLDMTFMYTDPLNNLSPFSYYWLTNEQKEDLRYPLYSDSYNALNSLFQENHELEFYCMLYPKLDILHDLFRIGNKIAFSDFCIIENDNPSFLLSEQAEKYKELLEECIKEIAQPQS